MGYSITRFVASVDANLLCSICSAVLEDPVLTPCGHSFCLLCLETWLEHSGASSCPECRGAIGSDETRPIRSVRNLINGLEVRLGRVRLKAALYVVVCGVWRMRLHLANVPLVKCVLICV